MKPYFIVGTGRCGSTMLSNLLNTHPEILSVSEFFSAITDLGGRIPEMFSEDVIDGATFWGKISAVLPRKNTMIKQYVDMPEVLYPYLSEGAVYSRESGVPAILHTTLPHLTERYEELYQRVGGFIKQQPEARLRCHYDTLFSYLTAEFKKSVWVERSGGVCVCIDELYKMYPDANFIHIVRDGRNTAISMRRHTGFRMFMLASTISQYLGVDPFESDDRSNSDRLPEELHCFLPENFDREKFLDFRFSHKEMGDLWTHQISNGMRVLNALPSDRVLTLGYENFCAKPQEHLEKITDFMGLKRSSKWEDEMANNVKLSVSSWLNESDAIQMELEASCRAGMTLLDEFYQ